MNRQNDDIKSDVITPNTDDTIYYSNKDVTDSNSKGFRQLLEDADDFVYKRPERTSKRSSGHSDSDDIDKSTHMVAEDNIVVYSTRSSSKHHHSHGSGYHNRKHHHHHHHKHKKMKLWKKILIISISVILALAIIITATITLFIYKGSQELFTADISVSAPEGVIVQDEGQYVVYNGCTYKYNENVTSILCMGVDKRQIDETAEVVGAGGQTDVIILVAIDTSTGKITLINVSRDTMTDVTIYSGGGSYIGTEKQQLCLAYAYGDGEALSCENTVTSVKKIFYNIPINTYFALDLDGIAALNDSVGGVEVVSPETIDIFTEGQTYHLLGSDAERFVRKRDTNVLDSNNYRMKRQQVYLNSFMNTVISQAKNDIGVPLALFNGSAPYSCTNLNPSRVMYLAQAAITGGSMAIETVSVPGQIKAGEKYAEFYVDEEKFYEQFINIFYTPVEK